MLKLTEIIFLPKVILSEVQSLIKTQITLSLQCLQPTEKLEPVLETRRWTQTGFAAPEPLSLSIQHFVLFTLGKQMIQKVRAILVARSQCPGARCANNVANGAREIVFHIDQLQQQTNIINLTKQLNKRIVKIKIVCNKLVLVNIAWYVSFLTQ